MQNLHRGAQLEQSSDAVVEFGLPVDRFTREQKAKYTTLSQPRSLSERCVCGGEGVGHMRYLLLLGANLLLFQIIGSLGYFARSWPLFCSPQNTTQIMFLSRSLSHWQKFCAHTVCVAPRAESLCHRSTYNTPRYRPRLYFSILLSICCLREDEKNAVALS
jgi:hypothetical protein